MSSHNYVTGSSCRHGVYKKAWRCPRCRHLRHRNLKPLEIIEKIAKLIIGTSALFLSGGLAAQTFKCSDAAGKITYSNTECRELGLKDSGEIENRLNVSPAYRPPAEGIGSPHPSAPAPASEAQNVGTPAAAEKPAEPERRCFTVKTAKGMVTRCNDKPDE